MTVHFIGAGPGAVDLITLRGRKLIGACPVCLYAGSIIPVELLEHCPPDARKVDTAPLKITVCIPPENPVLKGYFTGNAIIRDKPTIKATSHLG